MRFEHAHMVQRVYAKRFYVLWGNPYKAKLENIVHVTAKRYFISLLVLAVGRYLYQLLKIVCNSWFELFSIVKWMSSIYRFDVIDEFKSFDAYNIKTQKEYQPLLLSKWI